MSEPSTMSMQTARPWAPRAALMPATAERDGAYTVASNGSAGCYGGWELVYPAPGPGQWVKVEVTATWCGLERGYDSVNTAMAWLNASGQQIGWEPVFSTGMRQGKVLFEGRAPCPDGATQLVLKLLMAHSARGEIVWHSSSAEPIAAPAPRRARLGAAAAPLPPGERCLETNARFYLDLCREAARKEIDLLCLPEVMLAWGLPTTAETLPGLAVAVPGPEVEPFQRFAAENGMALCFSVWEKDGELVHNTALLINAGGDIVGRYRKVHLAQPFEVWWGVTPGHDFPVFDLGWAKVGMNICMDSSAAESARVPARQGAEIICLPIMGDHRASTCFFGGPHDFDVERWRMIQRMRAMDNHVYMVVSRNSGIGTGVFSPRGEALAMSGGAARVVHADVDLEDIPRTGPGATFRGICWYERREPAYGPLIGESQPDPFGGA